MRALDLLKRRLTIDYGSKKTESKATSENGTYYLVF
ncbi:hypothetical protein FOTG_18975 [Fusarium oxysporum f. sp. vasinfectum 25433]|nr:hypothetical protein FOTG_18975 [Fusarium oxysporum f. sp. vasinfectum 25433]